MLKKGWNLNFLRTVVVITASTISEGCPKTLGVLNFVLDKAAFFRESNLVVGNFVELMHQPIGLGAADECSLKYKGHQ